jgi:ABC-type polysaccharide/polyol phosphate export permease
MESSASYRREDPSLPSVDHFGLGSLFRYRFALRNLILKDFRVRYRNMSLGILWSVLNPLVMLGVMVIVFAFIYPNRHQVHFPVFLLIGLVVYNFISMVLPPTTTAIIDNVSLVKKVIFPRVLIPISVVFSQLMHFFIQLGLLIFFLFVFSVPVQWTWLWLIPIVFILCVFALGFAFALSALNVTYRDTLYVVESALKVFFWLTPVFYDLYQVKLNLPRPLYFLYVMNPLAGCIDAIRRALLLGANPDPFSLGMAMVVSVVIFAWGWGLFSRKQHAFADQL